MREHRAFGRPCGAGCINQDGRVLRAHIVETRIKFLLQFFKICPPQFVKLIHEHYFWMAEGFEPVIIENNNLFHQGQFFFDFEKFIKLFFVFDEQNPRLAVNANMFQLGI